MSNKNDLNSETKNEMLAGGTQYPHDISMLSSASINSRAHGWRELRCVWGVLRSGEHAENVKYETS